MISRYPQGVQPCYKPEEHVFKSVNGLSRTQRVACLPASLGPGGRILRPLRTDKAVRRFLISLPFLLFCRAQLDLDPQHGLCMKLRRFNHEIPLHIGPTGALRVPLDQFDEKMQKQLRSALDTLREPNLEANLLKAEEPDQEDPLHAGSIRPNTSARDLICNMPQTNKRQKHVTDEEKHHRRQFHWRRMVLRLHHHGQQPLPDGGEPSGPSTRQHYTL